MLTNSIQEFSLRNYLSSQYLEFSSKYSFLLSGSPSNVSKNQPMPHLLFLVKKKPFSLLVEKIPGSTRSKITWKLIQCRFVGFINISRNIDQNFLIFSFILLSFPLRKLLFISKIFKKSEIVKSPSKLRL